MLVSLLSVAAAAAEPAGPVAGVPTAAVSAAHVADCIAAAKPGLGDESLLQQRGWVSMNVRVNGGTKPPFGAFTKPNDMSVLMLSVSRPKGGECVLLMPTPTVAEANAIQAALGRSSEQATGSAPKGADSWTTSTHQLSLVEIGNAQARGLRLTVNTLENR